MFGKKVLTNAKKVDKRERNLRILKILLFSLLMILIIVYLILKIIYTGGKFTISLDDAGNKASSLVIYDSLENKNYRRTLQADMLEFMTNISVKWLPENIDEEADGGHNGDNYIAYTFYIENQGTDTINYWYEVNVDDVVLKADDAIRFMIILNGNKTIYAKQSTSGEPEEGTVAFKADDTITIEERANFESGEIDKCTVVIWLEGDDPECIDNIIGGEVKMHMSITEEHIEQ